MLGKTSVSMMVLLVAASLIGISSIHQYIEGSPTQRKVQLVGQVTRVVMHMSPSEECWGLVVLPGPGPNLLGLPPGTAITLMAPIESCTLFGLAKTSKTPIHFVVLAPTAAPSTERQYNYNAIQVAL